MNTEISKRLYDEAIRLMPGGVNSPVRAFSPYPFFISEGTGSKIKDVDGNTYIDYCMAYGPLIFGHADPDIIEAIRTQLNKGTMFGIPTPFENELAKLIIGAFPSIEMVRLVNSGADIRAKNNYALRYASLKKHLKVVKFLVNNGADVRAKNNFAVREASKKGHNEIVKYLILHGAEF